MSRARAIGLALLAPVALAAAAPGAGVPEIAFDSAPDPVTLPKDVYFGEVSGVAVNRRGHVFVFSRGNTSGPAYAQAAAQLLEFDASGRFVREIGRNLYGWATAHSVKIDPWDNIWVTDKGSDVVVRFNPAGRVTMVIGKKKDSAEAAARPKPGVVLPPLTGEFRQVTDIAWAPDGAAFISDGYVNSRVVRLSRDGDWLGSFGTPGAGPGQFDTPHAIATDAGGLVYVADRGNRRIQVFDRDGRFRRQITIDVPVPADARPSLGERPKAGDAMMLGVSGSGTMLPGAPWALCITPGPKQYLYVADAFPGRIYKLDLDGNVLGMLGGTGKTLKHFGWVHQIACPSENVLWVAELLNWRVQKLVLHPRS